MAISAADIATLSRLLDEALELDASLQAGWLAALPPEHQRHAGPLREMLAAQARGATDDRLSTLPKLPEDESVARAGERVGPYRLIREIGRGGMGSVWLAARADGSFKREVALKLPRLAWGAGLAGRMAREREIGALLEHPNIARLYDAGVDALGRPFLALEYIAGQPIDAWCETGALAVSQRLRLFLQVARAVAYAHGRLVIHRDIKPSNVLVTADGQAHLLDFGIAKLLTETDADSKLTQEQGRALTPHYASPEQMRGEVITVASDVYSLGVLLYELLTRRLPYDSARTSLATLEAAMLDGEPPSASSRAPDSATAKLLRGDLNAILAKALKREPLKRYATADALAADIERYLNGDTVLALPDSVGYRLAKSIKKHRVGFAAVGAVVLAVMAGAAASLIQAQRANDAAERARVVKEFVVDVFKVNGRGSTANIELRQLPAEMLLERGAQLIEPRFAGQPQLQAELYGVVANIFADIGAAQLSADYASRQLAALSASGATRREQAQAMLLLARALEQLGRTSEAMARARAAFIVAEGEPEIETRARLALVKILISTGAQEESLRHLDLIDRALTGRPDAAPSDTVEASNLRALWLSRQNRFDEARRHFEHAIAIATRSGVPALAAETQTTYARYLVSAGFGEEGRLQAQAALASLRAAGGPEDVQAALMEANTAFTLHQAAALSFEQARDMVANARTILSSRPNLPRSFIVQADFAMGAILAFSGRLEEADQVLSRITAEDRRKARERPQFWKQLSFYLAFVAMYLGRHEEADANFRESIAVGETLSTGSNLGIAMDYSILAMSLWMQQRFNEAESLLAGRPVIKPLVGSRDDKRLDVSADSLRVAHARLKLESGDAAGALRLLPAVDKYGASTGEEHALVRGSAMCVLGQPAEGLRYLDEYLQGVASLWWQFDPDLARARAVAGLCALAAGDRVRAIKLAEQARDALQKQPGLSRYFRAPSERLDRQLQSQRARR